MKVVSTKDIQVLDICSSSSCQRRLWIYTRRGVGLGRIL